MYKRVFKQKGSRVYRLRYRLSDGPRIYDVPLHTHVKEVADAKARQLMEAEERRIAGIGAPALERAAAIRPFVDHVADFVAHLEERSRNRDHVRHTRDRLLRLAKDCRWKLLRDVSADSFNAWRGAQSLSAKTLNEYLAHSVALFNWLMRTGRVSHSPLRGVFKLPKEETFRRRALAFDEFVRFTRGCPRNRLMAYLVACCTGLRRGELKQLQWSDVDLSAADPAFVLRPETTKNKKGGRIPLLPIVVELLITEKAKGVDFSGRVFPRGLPSVKTLHNDLRACEIEPEDERGFRVDFHALRHTFVSLLAQADVSELVRVKLARHSSWKQTDGYTDEKSVPLAAGMAKLAALLPSSIASPKTGKSRPKVGKLVRAVAEVETVESVDFRGERPVLAMAVPSWESSKLVPKGGLEPPCG